jgi:hypothetical protein
MRFLLLTFALSALALGAAPNIVASGNKVEPLSNGLALTMTANQVIAKFGKPDSDDRSYGGGIGYPSFGLIYNAAGTQIWHATVKSNGVKLASGITVGSTPEQVSSVFGNSSGVTYQQYKLTFLYSGGVVYQIKIDPANGQFSAASSSTTSTKKVALVGKWQGINGTPGRLVLRSNHTYTYSVGGGGGTWRATTSGAFFTGTLRAWNRGFASTKRGVLEFYWTRANGAKAWFVFQKIK